MNFLKNSICKFSFFLKKKIDEKLLERIDSSRFIVLDTETTGFDYTNDRILCIGAIELINGVIKIERSLEIYICQDHYNSSTAQIHGILKKEILDQKSELEALNLFTEFIEDATIVAHHAFFDIKMINTALERNGLPTLKNKILDTSTLYKKTIIKSYLIQKKEHYSLDELADKFNISKKDRHTALGDAYITAIVFLKILKKIKSKGALTLYQLMK